jgi:hypothetical protein
MGSFHARPKSPEVVKRAAKVMKALRSRACGRLYSKNTLLQGLAQDLEDVTPALRECIEAGHAVVRQRHLPQHQHVATADQPDIRNSMVGARHGRVVSRASARLISGRRVVRRRPTRVASSQKH